MTVSLSGLDMSWLKKPATVTRGRYRVDKKSGDVVTAREWHRRNPVKRKRGDVAAPYFMPDVDAAYGGSWKSIIDGTEISSRTNWREHNKRNEVLQVPDDYWGKSEDHHISEIEARMEYDPSLVGSSDFEWKDPE